MTASPLTTLAAGGRLPPRDHLTGVDAHPQAHLDAVLPLDSVRERREHVANREGGAHGSFRIVLVRLRGSEHCEDRVADELLRHAAEALDGSVDETKEVSLQRTDVLEVLSLAECGRTGKIGEQDGDDASLLVLRDGRGTASSGL